MEDLKKIVSVFIKKNPEEISAGTLINSAVIPGSILIHRMYAAINNQGYKIKQYSNIDTYGELVSLLTNGTIEKTAIAGEGNSDQPEISEDDGLLIGVDIESVDNLPVTNDFREHEFYKENFSANEISYCLLKLNPYETFAGLFSAKEALCKVNNKLRGKPFNKIEITHAAEGKPIFEDYSISISHTPGHSVAVALLNSGAKSIKTEIYTDEQPDVSLIVSAASVKNNRMIIFSFIFSFLSLLMTLILLFLYLRKGHIF